MLLLQVQYPDAYPDEPPHLDIVAPAHAVQHPFLNVEADKVKLLSSLSQAVDDNLGMAMIFSLVSALKDGAEQLIRERQAHARAARDAKFAEAEEKEQKKFDGPAVTRQSFLEWRAKFLSATAEEAARKQEAKEAEDRRKRLVKEERRLTGRELWEKGLAGKAEDYEDGSGGWDDLLNLKLEKSH